MIEIGQGLLEYLESIIRKAGEILLEYRPKQLKRIFKKHAGFMTEADVASEKYIIEQLQQFTPKAKIFSEETGNNGNEKSEYCWVIDPLDGTTNFSYGLPHFCISIALTHKDEPLFGIVYQPVLDELFYAFKGKGAFLNGKKIQVSNVKHLENSFIVLCFPYKKDGEFKRLLNREGELNIRATGVRQLGAAALDCAYVACGRFEAMCSGQLAWWDVAAGKLIIQEAGGTSSTFEGELVKPGFQTFVGSNKVVHAELIGLLQRQ